MTMDKGNLARGLVVSGKNWSYFDVKMLSVSTWKVHENEMMKLRDQQDTSLQHGFYAIQRFGTVSRLTSIVNQTKRK